MTDEVVITKYHCSACNAIVTSEGTNALDHMVAEHGVDPEAEGPQDGAPYLIPVESNPTLDEDGVPQ
jgi:hypothetical protein